MRLPRALLGPALVVLPFVLGYQFRGYDLDAQRRPTFHYEYGEVKVDDFFEDETTKNGQTFFRRTIRFTAPANTAPFFFRAACGTKVANITASLGGAPLRSMRQFLNMGTQATRAAAASALADQKVLVALEEVDIRAPIYDPCVSLRNS